MSRQFTENQKRAIMLRNKNILVSAAAGSGKTAVLVERIIRLISEGDAPYDIDRLLIVTFTNAAAAEMKERITAAISEKLAHDPENAHLQRQITLIHNAQITTIHSFCLFVIRNHFQEIGLDPAFRVADEGETGLLMQDVLAEILEEAFEELSPAFQRLVEAYSTGKIETLLEENILSLYRFAVSYPWPVTWLKEHGNDYEFAVKEELEQAVFMRYIMEYMGRILPELEGQLRYCVEICHKPDGPHMYGKNIEDSLDALQKACREKTFSALRDALERVTFERLSSQKDDSVDAEKREYVKQLRNDVKKQVEQIKEQFFLQSDEAVFAQCKQISPIVKELTEQTIRFGERFAEKKREQNLIDFSDMEHLALNILCRRVETAEGVEIEPTAAALELRDYFKEIMIDEYQDSNLVQESILHCISGENNGCYNRFMVGDVKQSIYKFRLARPEIFMEKFHTYTAGAGERQKIDLYQNFRSRKEVLKSVNLIFEQILGNDLGGIDYDETAKLYYGAAYYDEGIEEEAADNRTEFLLIEKDEEQEQSAIEQEAEVIALRIKELMRTQKVFAGSGEKLRSLRYGDIVILLRSGSGVMEAFEEVFGKWGIPCMVSSKTGYFQAPEVQTLLQLLRVIDNPLQDIPLFGVLKSCFASFGDVEIAKVAAAFPGRRKLYKKVEAYAEKEDTLAEKCRRFLGWYRELRRCSVWLSVREMLTKIMTENHYLEYVTAMPGGAKRRANAQMLLQKAMAFEKTSFKGLYHFIRYIDQMEKYQIDQGEAGILEETADTVRIMTIHKSKGLEFPVCFVAGMGRKMNRRDASAQALTDVDMGIAVDLVDPMLRIKRKTLKKTALSKKILLDSQAEELRILYVALTRAKEKLIITGVIDNVEKYLYEKMSILAWNDVLLPYLLRSGAGSFMELLTACMMRTESMAAVLEQYGIKSEIQPMYPEEDIVCKAVRAADRQTDVLIENYYEVNNAEIFKTDLITCVTDEEVRKSLQSRFDYQYPHAILQKLYAKTTVSELKMAAIHAMTGDIKEESDGGKRLFEEEMPAPYLPRFLRNKEEKKKISGAARGSAMHLVMELMDFGKEESAETQFGQYTIERLERDLEKWHTAGRLSEEYKEAVSREKIVRLMNTPLAKRMRCAARAGLLWKEQRFMLGIGADRLSEEFPETERVIVQGIIDVFWEEDGEIVLLDYKTDVIKSPEELAERYKVQMEYYAEALERLTGKRVKERILYSFYLGEEVYV